MQDAYIVIEPAIVFVPGNMCDASMWEGMRSAFDQTGLSVGHADTSQDDTIVAMAQRALATFDGPLIPVGFSMGGIVALEMVRQAPSRMAGLALIGTNPGADLPERAAARPIHQQRVRGGALETILRDELMPLYLTEANRKNVSLTEPIVQMALDMGEEVFVSQSEALRQRGDNWQVLQSLEQPVFVACGDQDALCPPEWHRRMAEALPQAELHVIPNAAHMLPLEQPELLGGLLRDYIRRILVEGTAQ